MNIYFKDMLDRLTIDNEHTEVMRQIALWIGATNSAKRLEAIHTSHIVKGYMDVDNSMKRDVIRGHLKTLCTNSLNNRWLVSYL